MRNGELKSQLRKIRGKLASIMYWLTPPVNLEAKPGVINFMKVPCAKVYLT